jgi:predicted tellurium resistance membrane protein TerC
MTNWSDEFSQLWSLHGLISLLTLTILEIVLGIDNIIFISLAVNKLPKLQQKRARTIGLLLALAVRTVLLFFIGMIAGLKHPFFYLGAYGISGKALILFGGGLFLLIKTWKEIKDKMYEDEDEIGESRNAPKTTFNAVILQIIIIDFVFSFDSILAAVGLSGIILIMITAVVISMLLMILFSGKVADFINRNRGIKMIAMVFLLVIGGILVAESLVDCYNTTLPEKEHLEINKNYAYLALAFAILVELFNMKERKIKRSQDFTQNQ